MTRLRESEWYATVSEFEDIENQYLSNQYEEFWNNRDDDDLDELRERFSERFNNRRSASQYRKNALTTVMSAFLNRHGDNGRIYEETGWAFQELDPFELEDDVSADILLAKPAEGETMAVMLLPERRSPESVVQESKQAIETIQENLSRSGFQTDPDEVHSAIVVNPPRGEETKNAIESENGEYTSDIFVWRVYEDTGEGETDDSSGDEHKVLDYYADLDEELNSTGPNMRLLEVLEDGVRINQGREILPDFFVQSHHSLFLEHIIGHVVQRRKEAGDGPLTHFTKAELEEFVEDTLFHREVSEEASDKVKFLLTRWRRMDLINSISASRNDIGGEDFYRFTVDGNMDQDSIIREVTGDYRSRTVEFYIQVEAMNEALNAYRDEYGEQATLGSN